MTGGPPIPVCRGWRPSVTRRCWGETAASPAARCPAGLSFECHGSDVSVDTDTPVLGAGNETSWTCPRRRIEYGGNQIFVKISS